jgi:hypothetical protein
MRATLAAGALILAAVAGATAQHWDPYTRQLDRGICTHVDIAEDVDGTGVADLQVRDLQARGWFGDPADQADRLYSPACR